MHILIVDDNPIDIAILRRQLDDSLLSKVIIDVAYSVNEGLKLVAEIDFDVILLDYQMPELNGIDMINELRTQANLGNTAIIVVSSTLDENITLQCIEAGAQDFISKSEISKAKLYQAIVQAKKRFEMEQKKHESFTSVKTLAEKDPLTGLHNRYFFSENLKFMLAQSKRSKESVGMIAMDLDNFKHVNDSLGHEAGDLLLQGVVDRVKNCLRINDAFSRLGGDEFNVTCGNINSVDEVHKVARRIIKSFKEPFTINDKRVNCSVSIGAALFPHDASNSRELIKCADVAMYRAKQSGKNTICFYESHYQNEFKQQYLILNEMRDILSSSTFRLFYQAIFSAKTNEVIGFEALIRWPDATNMYTPDVFIPIAEESRLINDIGQWVIDVALKQLSEWHAKYSRLLTISINISPIQLQNTEAVDYLVATAKKYALNPNLIILEITETALFEKDKNIVTSLTKLSAHGFKIALDDFGMGFSSISHLVNFTIDIVKLDKSMQSVDDDSPKKQNVFTAVSTMLKQLQFTVVAEGIENESQLAFCKECHIDRVQGFLLGVPLPANKAEAALDSMFIAK